MSDAQPELVLLFDASALAKAYIREEGSHVMQRLLAHPTLSRGEHFVVSSIVEPEVVKAIVSSIRLPVTRQAALTECMLDIQTRRLFTIVDAVKKITRGASRIIGRHPEWRIHGADAIHLATAELLAAGMPEGSATVVVTADGGMYEAAQEMPGLSAFNPCRHDIPDLYTLLPKRFLPGT